MTHWITLAVAWVLASSALGAGFSVRAALNYPLGLEGELEYAAIVEPGLTWGVRLSAQKTPDADLVLIIPNAFIEYRKTVKENTSLYSKLELGIGWLPQFFPRAVLTLGIDSRYSLAGLDVVSQASIYLDFIVTNRAKLGSTGRFGLIVIPFVPFIGLDLSQEFYSNTFTPKLYAGSLLYLSQQLFIGLETGSSNGAYARLFFQFSE
jgi:hypothetical protein